MVGDYCKFVDGKCISDRMHRKAMKKNESTSESKDLEETEVKTEATT